MRYDREDDSGTDNPYAPPPEMAPTPTPTTTTVDPRLAGLWEASHHDVNAFIKAYIAAEGLTANQSDPRSLQKIVDAVNVVYPGHVAMDQIDSNGHLGGIILDGVKKQLINGSNGWTDLTDWPAESHNGPGASISIDPAYLQPFNLSLSEFAPGAYGAQAPNGSPNVPQFHGPGAFQMPTAQSILDDPSYQFRRDQAVDVLGKNRTAQGLYNSGGTLNDVTNLASNFAGQEYNNIVNRNFGIWDADWRHSLDAFDREATGNNEAYSRANQQYLNARETYFANQSNPWAKVISAANLGANTAAIAG